MILQRLKDFRYSRFQEQTWSFGYSESWRIRKWWGKVYDPFHIWETRYGFAMSASCSHESWTNVIGWIRFYSWPLRLLMPPDPACWVWDPSRYGSPWKVGKLRWKKPEAVAAAGAKAWCLQCLGQWCRFPMFFGRFSYASGEIQHPPRLDGFEEKK